MVRLLLHNALRVDEADIADIGEDSGHRVLRVVRRAKVPLTPATMAALEALPGRPGAAGRGGRLRAAERAAARHRRGWTAPLGASGGAGALLGPHRRDRRLGAALAAQPAPLDHHLRPV
ncbi:MAG TPA: hypothetical protein VHN16_17010 [Streptosporangiaceae bacterium]|nr:hypothetical protein [Streptosporangiaceae bacterium]